MVPNFCHRTLIFFGYECVITLTQMDFCVKNNTSVCDEIDLENAQFVEGSRRYPLLRYRTVAAGIVPVDSVGRTVSVFLSSTPAVWRIRDVYPGSDFFPSRIELSPSRIPDPRQRI